MNDQLLNRIANSLNWSVENISLSPLSGGDINNVYHLTHRGDSAVVKINDARRFPGMFKREAEGLDMLRSMNSGLVIPQVIAVIDDEGNSTALLIEFLENEHTPPDEEELGRCLANLHKQQLRDFGWHCDNYIGSLLQKNARCQNWSEFYAEYRLKFMARKAQKILGPDLLTDIMGFSDRLHNYIPLVKPSLLHGDLWRGNVLHTTRGPALIDPAIYRGHFEIDLAMTKLFGGFGEDFYSAYHDVNPSEPDLDERILIYQLYPLLVHVNLFGASYVNDVRRIIQRFK